MSDKEVFDHAEVTRVEYAKPDKQRGCVGHLKRKWWAYLLGLVLVVVIVVPIM